MKKPTDSLSEEGDLHFFLAALENLEGEVSALLQALVCHKMTESKTSWQTLLFLGVEVGGSQNHSFQLPAGGSAGV